MPFFTPVINPVASEYYLIRNTRKRTRVPLLNLYGQAVYAFSSAPIELESDEVLDHHNGSYEVRQFKDSVKSSNFLKELLEKVQSQPYDLMGPSFTRRSSATMKDLEQDAMSLWVNKGFEVNWKHYKLTRTLVTKEDCSEHYSPPTQQYSLFLQQYAGGIEVKFDDRLGKYRMGQHYAGMCSMNPDLAISMPLVEFISQASYAKIALLGGKDKFYNTYLGLVNKPEFVWKGPRKKPQPQEEPAVVNPTSCSSCNEAFSMYRKSFDGVCGDCKGGGTRVALDVRIEATKPKEPKGKKGPWRSATWEEDC